MVQKRIGAAVSWDKCSYCECMAIAIDADGKAWCGRSHLTGDHGRYPPSRNDPCPCGSALKHKHCCWGKPPVVRKCRKCGCTENQACRMGDGGRCRWVAPDLCSACTQRRATSLHTRTGADRIVIHRSELNP